MNEDQRNALRQCHVDLIKDLEPKYVLDALYEDGILTDNDLELIQAESSSRGRCQLLLSILPRRGPTAYGSFQRALNQTKYTHLVDILENVEEGNNTVTVSSVPKVLPDIERYCDKLNDDTSSKRTLDLCECCNEYLESKILPVSKESNFIKILKKLCCVFMHNIEPRELIDEFFQHLVLSDDRCERIRVAVTRIDRCQLFFQELVKVNKENVLTVFLKSLKKKYSYIVDDIEYILSNMVSSCNEESAHQQEWLQNQTKPMEIIDSTYKDKTLTKYLNSNEQNNIKYSRSRRKCCSVLSNRLPNDSEDSDELTAYESLHVLDECDGSSTVSSTIHNDSRKFTGEPYFDSTVDHHDEKGRRSAGKNKQGYRTNTHANITNIEESFQEALKVKQKGKEETQLQSNLVNGNRMKSIKISSPIAKLGSVSPNGTNRKLSVAFNYLSTLINEGQFEKFEFLSQQIQQRFPTNYDMLCIIGYLKTSRDLFETNFDSAKQNISSTLEIVPKTTNPRYFTLELYTAKTRMYITQKKLEKLQTALDDAMMILETDPVGCSGRAAGWLYINDARNQTAKLSILNLSKHSALKVYEQLYERAKTSFKRAMTNFKSDGGKDGPFGFGYALCRLVILLLRCGDNGLTMNTLTPLTEDIDAAEKYIKHLEDSDIALPKILEMHLRLAKCDYYFRRENSVRALEHAETAYNLANELKLLEFTEHAHNRLTFLCSRSKLTVKELEEDEVHDILFGESSSDTLASQSD